MIYGKGMYLREIVKEDIDMAYDLCVNNANCVIGYY